MDAGVATEVSVTVKVGASLFSGYKMNIDPRVTGADTKSTVKAMSSVLTLRQLLPYSYQYDTFELAC